MTADTEHALHIDCDAVNLRQATEAATGGKSPYRH